MKKGIRIFLTGFMGSGKTFWGKIWARENGLLFFDLDEEIERILGETIAQVFERRGETYFREKEKEILEKFAFKDDFVLACGGGTPCFFQNISWMKAQGDTLYLKASANQILSRIINETAERPLVRGLSTGELLAFIEQKLEEREPFYNQANYILEVGGLTPVSLAEILNNNR